MALTASRQTARKGPSHVEVYPVAASAVIHNGGQVAINAAGFAVPAAATEGLKIKGRAEESVDNTGGSNGDLKVRVSRGLHKWANAASTSALVDADRGRPVFARDDETVGNWLSGEVAGVLEEIDADGGIWVNQRQDSTYDERGTETKASGALSPHIRHSNITVSGAQAFTLAAGVRLWQRKTIRCTATDNTGTLTIATMIDGSAHTLAFDAVGEEVELEWQGAASGWRIVHLVGATLA